jgi:hypothetical protein
MDFAFTQEQEALRELARSILEDHVTHDRLKALEADGQWLDRGTWNELAKASLLGVALPEKHGGSGLGLVELCLVLEQIGRTVAPVPVLASLALGALPVEKFGSAAQQRRLLPGVVSGEVILTAALTESGNDDPTNPITVARRDGAMWRLDGEKTCVPAADVATGVLVPARTDGGVGLFLVDPQSSGVTVARQILTNREPHAQLTLNGVAAEPIGDPATSGEVVRWLWERALAAYCAVQVGVCDRALRMTAEYTIGRHQFDKPIASFQAVHQRAADAYIDLEAMRLSTWEAVYRLSEGLPATDAVVIAKFWAAEGGQHVAVASQHLHGGIGVDVDYPLHRYFMWAKHIELMLGGAAPQLARLGKVLAADPAFATT